MIFGRQYKRQKLKSMTISGRIEKNSDWLTIQIINLYLVIVEFLMPERCLSTMVGFCWKVVVAVIVVVVVEVTVVSCIVWHWLDLPVS
jgi:hypothetical protein